MMPNHARLLLALLPLAVVPLSCQIWPFDSGAATSLYGETLVVAARDGPVQDRQEAELTVAEAAFRAAPTSAMSAIWFGRRTAYLGRYRDAVEIYSDALLQHPNSPELLRHRGHRFITLRKFAAAIEDYERAARLIRGQQDMVEADGQPNSRNIPNSTLHTNIWYHLGLAHYLRGEYALAEIAYRNCLAKSKNRDMEVAARYWLYLSLSRQLKQDAADAVAAKVGRNWDIIENHAYHRLLLLYDGKLDVVDFAKMTRTGVQDATLAYGLCNYSLSHGDRDAAIASMHRLLDTKEWAAFGYIAAEADLLRMGESR